MAYTTYRVKVLANEILEASKLRTCVITLRYTFLQGCIKVGDSHLRIYKCNILSN